MSYPTFYKSGTGYTSRSENYPRRMSPVYLAASAAKKLIETGKTVRLPNGYDLEALDRVTWLTGTYDQNVNVSARQADEVATIGRELLENFSDELDSDETAAIQEVLKVTANSE